MPCTIVTMALAAVAVSTGPAAAGFQTPDPAVCPLHAQHMAPPKPGEVDDGHDALDARGAAAMGFDQSRASHHFRLSPEGGSIEIHVNQPGDHETHGQVVAHLTTIARQFTEGDFGIPHATHAEDPVGVATMKRLAHEIAYAFEPAAHGGRVTIRTTSPEALAAVHEFLRYQIREHRTGDPIEVRP